MSLEVVTNDALALTDSDLDEMASGGGALARLLEDLSWCVRLMRRLPCPVVIAAHGGPTEACIERGTARRRPYPARGNAA